MNAEKKMEERPPLQVVDESTPTPKAAVEQPPVKTMGRKTLVLGAGTLLLALLAGAGWAMLKHEGGDLASLKNVFGTKTADASIVAPAPAVAVVIARVGGEAVYESEIAAEIAAGARGSRNDIVDAYINTVVAAQVAQAAGTAEAKEALEYARRKVLSQVFITSLARKEAAEITEAQVKEFYDKQIPASAFDRYAVSYYLTQDPGDAETRFMEMQAGKSLDKLVALENKQTKTKFIAGSELPYGTGQVVSRMKKGEITRPLATRDGYLLLRVDGIETGAKAPLEQLAPQIRNMLLQQRVSTGMADRRKAADIRIVQ